MCGNCKLISAVLIALVGLLFLLQGLGIMTNAVQVSLIVGVLLLLFGLGGIVHALNMCPACVDCCKSGCKSSK